MPELPGAMRSRLCSQGLSKRDAEVLMSVDSGREVEFDGERGSGGAVAYFESLSEGRDPKIVVNWWGFSIAEVQMADWLTYPVG
jgi:aspartyl-tRNA(Asn)/glutamyl-tRNA(Gln) amidotransferase subunit B